MNIFRKIVTLTLLTFAVTVYSFSQEPAKHAPATTTVNLVRGAIGPFTSNGSWSNYSVLDQIPGSALYPVVSSTAVFYWGFTAGTTANISNMVLYTTAHGSLKVTAVTPVKLAGISNPMISLSNTSVCPVQPLSATNPCIVKFDPVSISLSPASDYYLTVYYANDTNNGSIGAVQPGVFPSSMSGVFLGGTDATRLTVGQTLPSRTTSPTSYFLMYVMNN